MPTLAVAEDLIFHYKLALDGDPKLRSAEANYHAVRETHSQSKSNFLPNITGSANRNRNTEEVTTDSTIFSRPTGRASYSSTEYRLNLSQPIYNAALLARLHQTSADMRRAEAEYLATQQETMFRVAQTYFDVLLAEETLALVRAEKDSITHQLESAQARLKAGLASITEVHDAKARVQLTVAEEVEVQNALDDKQDALREISGRTPENLAPLGEAMPLILPEPNDIRRWIDTALTQNLSLQAAKASVESAQENISQHRAGHYPTVNAIGSRTRVDADGSIAGPGVRSDETVVGVQLNVPIFQGGLVSARVNEAAYRKDAAEQDLEARRRAVERATRAAFLGVVGAKTKIEALQETIASAKSSVDAKTQGYRVGLYKTVDVLDATRDLYRAQRDYAEARHSYALYLLQLKLAAGTLNEEDILAINGWLQQNKEGR